MKRLNQEELCAAWRANGCIKETAYDIQNKAFLNDGNALMLHLRPKGKGN